MKHSSRLIAGQARQILLPLTLLLLVSLACSIPLSVRNTPTPEVAQTPSTPAEPTVVSAPVEQATPLPEFAPALVEVDPIPLSEIAPGTAPVFYFNQAMERASVESAFQVQPDVAGQLEWVDDATVRFVLSEALPAGASLDLTIGAEARAANGQALAEPVVVNYQSSGPLQVAERLPVPGAVDVNPSSAVVVTFNRPVAALGAEQDTPPAFTLEPASPGRGEWLNTSTYIFYPDPGLMGGAQYNIGINPSLTSSDGAPLDSASAADWSFTTSAPVLLSVTPAFDGPVELDAQFVLTFNQPMDTASVEAGLSLLSPDGEPLPGTFAWNETSTEVTFQPSSLLERSSSYGLVLLGTARSQGGAVIGQDYAASLVTVPEFSVTQTEPAAGESLQTYSGYGSISLTFSSPIAAGQDISSLITLNPTVGEFSAWRNLDGYQVGISGYFQPSTSYTLTVDSGLTDKWDAALGMPYTFTFSSMPAQPFLDIPTVRAGGTSIFVPYGDQSIPASATNIDQLTLSRGSLTVEEFILGEQDWQGLQNWEGKVQETWDRFLNSTPDVSTPVDIPLTSTSSLLDAGLYFLKINTQPEPENWRIDSPVLVVVSPIQLVVKSSTDQAFAWAVRTAGREPAEGKTVSFYDVTALKIGECITGADGVCQTELPLQADPYQNIFAVIAQPGDPEFTLAASGWNHGVSPWDFRLSYQKKGIQPEIYLYTDRPIYQPGQAVNFRAVVREWENGRYLDPTLTELNIDVVSPYDPVTYQSQVLTTLRLPINEWGTANGIYTLPENARTGSYMLRVQEVEFEELYFVVEEYRKPEIDLQAVFSQPDVLAGEDILAQLSAMYFFGAPAGNLPVSWILFSEQAYLEIPDGLSTGMANTNWFSYWDSFPMGSRYVTEGKGQTNPDGSLTITIPSEEIMERLGDLEGNPRKLVLETTIEDDSGLPVSTRTEMLLHPSSYYVGVRSEMWSVQVGQEVTYYLRTVDWQSNPVPDEALTARFSKVDWVQQQGSDSLAPVEYRMEIEEVGSTDFSTSEQGEARLAFLPAEPGTYLFEVSGEGGAISQVLTWVGGAGSAAWPNLPNQRILLRSDKTAYQPGQSASIFIPNPFEGDTLALVTVERGKVMRSQITQISGSSYELELPLTEEDAPNIFLSVALLGRTGIRPDFRVGYLEIQVDPASLLLNVNVETSPEQAQPGENVTLNISVEDSSGSPIEGEFSLALIDKAVISLADPNSISIEEAFYAPQPLGVQAGYSLAKYAGRFMYVPPGRGGGGGGGDIATTQLVRENFEDTAYWNGTIVTDENGAAQINVRLPDNLTTWRADVRGLASGTLVGQAEVDLLTSKPLLIRPVAPRFVVIGDHLEMAAVVHNNTDNALQVGVRLDAAGFNFDNPDMAVQPVDVPARSQLRVAWWGTVQDVPELTPVFSVEGDGLRDAAQTEDGAIPVLHYAAPQTFGTAGQLAAAGERVEMVELPRSFNPLGGELRVEMEPSLSATVIDGLEAMEAFPYDFTEPVLSRLLPNLETNYALNELQVENAELRSDLDIAVSDGISRLVQLQNEDGGWGWMDGDPSDPYLSSYVLFGLSRASQVGVFVAAEVLEKGRDYLIANLFLPDVNTESWQLDRLAFQHFTLLQLNVVNEGINSLYEFRDKLSPWGKAFLALALDGQSPGDPRAQTLISDLEASASRSATGANWQDSSPAWHNWSTPNFTTAVVTYAIALLDPDSQVLQDAVRYLVLNRQPEGAWASSYESAWVLLALVETMRATGDLQSDYAYEASLNGSPLVTGEASGPSSLFTSVNAAVSIHDLNGDEPNELQIQRGEGSGSLYYRAYLEVSRPAEEAPAIQRGLILTRQFYRSGQDCRETDCQPISEIDLTDPQPVLVRLTLTVPEDMYYVVVEDYFPAGAEALNPRLKTSQQYIVPSEEPAENGKEPTLYDLANPFERGWGWWLFSAPETYTDRIHWIASYLPAGTYELTYRLTPFLAGEYHVVPARAWQYYFPEVEGATAGSLLIVR